MKKNHNVFGTGIWAPAFQLESATPGDIMKCMCAKGGALTQQWKCESLYRGTREGRFQVRAL
jgi:hypothetical protein